MWKGKGAGRGGVGCSGSVLFNFIQLFTVLTNQESSVSTSSREKSAWIKKKERRKERGETERKAEREKLSNGEILQIPARDVIIIASICCRKFCSPPPHPPTLSGRAHLRERVAEKPRQTSAAAPAPPRPTLSSYRPTEPATGSSSPPTPPQPPPPDPSLIINTETILQVHV